MEENVALDSTKQRKFVKSIKGIKKLIKKNEAEKPEEAESPKTKKEKVKSKRPERGLVYLSHIPHGFYENEMTQYFKQFGVVTNVRVIRSKRTGNSKGFAFVEFKEPTVAEIVAETMNNYLMGKRLIKAACIPPEKQRPKAMRKHWSRLNNPGKNSRQLLKKAYNENKDDEGELIRARKILSNINKTKKKLSELGINYDFFTPVDVPEAIQNSLKKDNDEIKENIVKIDKKSEKDKKASIVDVKDTKESLKKNKAVKVENQVKSVKVKAIKDEVKSSKVKNEEKKPNKSKKESKNMIEKQEPVVNKKEQKKKNQKLKDAGVNPPENFIKVQHESQDSDSSLEFDSDEYEKMLEEESGDDSDDEGDDGNDSDAVDSDNDDEGDDGNGSDAVDSDDDDDESDEEEEEVVSTPKKSKGKPVPVAAPQKQKHVPEQNKRKAPQKPPAVTKKPKFEKQTQQPMKKQFKKKK